LIGLGVDAVTGAGYEHTPNPVSVILQPDAPAPPRGRQPKKPATATPVEPPVAQPSKT
jgi:hypothetical protein